MIKIVGAGTGKDTITLKGLEAVKTADIIFGAKRLVDTYASCAKSDDVRIFAEYKAEAIVSYVQDNATSEDEIVILVSGDTGFYSLADSLLVEFGVLCEDGGLKKYEIPPLSKDGPGIMHILGHEVMVIPGISSFSSFFAKIGYSYEEAALISVHGRECNLVDAVRRNKITFMLTGGNIGVVRDRLISGGFGELEVYVGSNLDSEDETISHCYVKELKEECSSLTVLVIINKCYDARVLAGIPDDEFIRGDVPMTKSEVRAIVAAKLAISPKDICVDIGAGTGSVTVEMAHAAYEGRVIAIEMKEAGISLINENITKFHLGNVDVVHGEATEVLKSLEVTPDVAFIGGSNGNLRQIIDILLMKNKKMRIVITAIAIETLTAAMNIIKEKSLKCDITQINVSRNQSVGSLNLMIASNPVYILSINN